MSTSSMDDFANTLLKTAIATIILAITWILLYEYFVANDDKGFSAGTVTIQQDEKLFTGLAVTSFAEYRLDTEVALPVFVNEKLYAENAENPGLQLGYLVKICIQDVDGCGRNAKEGLIEVSLDEMLRVFCKTVKSETCKFKDPLLGQYKLLLPSPSYMVRIKNHMFKKDEYDTNRYPFTSGGEPVLDALLGANISNKKITKSPRGYCEKKYQLGFGYESFSKYLSEDFTEPAVLTANLIEMRVYSATSEEKSNVAKACEYFDYIGSYGNNNNKRKEFIKTTLSHDEISAQTDHALHLYCALKGNLAKQCTTGLNTTITSGNPQDSNDLVGVSLLDFLINNSYASANLPYGTSATQDGTSEPGGYIGALRVTISSSFSSEDNPILRWLGDKKLYARKDITNAYFGSYITNSILEGSSSPLSRLFRGRPIRTITLSNPSVIAIDRYINGIYIDKGYSYDNQTIAGLSFSLFELMLGRSSKPIKTTGVDDTINNGVKKTLDDYHQSIIHMAKSSTIKIVSQYLKNKHPDEEIRINFEQ